MLRFSSQNNKVMEYVLYYCHAGDEGDLFVNEGDLFDILLKDYKSTCFLALKRLFSPPAIIKKDYGTKYILFSF